MKLNEDSKNIILKIL